MAYTPQQQAENMMKGIKNTYQVVAKRHVHPWYSWALMAAAIGFTVGVAYVANLNAQFDQMHAAAPGRSIESMNKSTAIMQLLKTQNIESRIENIEIQRGVVNIVDGLENDTVTLGAKQPFNYLPDQKNESLLAALSALSKVGATYEIIVNESTSGRRGFLVFTDRAKLAKTDFTNYNIKGESPSETVTKQPDMCTCDISGKMTLMKTQEQNGKTTTTDEEFPINYKEKIGKCTTNADCVKSCLFTAENRKINALNKNYDYLKDDSTLPIILYSWFEGSSKNLKNASRCDNNIANVVALP